ncbi:hypothetical protein BGX28_001825 [Mortierella sp. GBA30]|nr:hypothetical protein BGX28_001825 [Mortierella sp. GBA30]
MAFLHEHKLMMDTTSELAASLNHRDHAQNPDNNTGFVAVHVGAGLHAAKTKARYLEACKRACQEGILLLRKDPTVACAAVVEHMIRILEDDPFTNAGTGSNLNLDGRVECDASLMNGTTLGFGSVGAVSDFKNPISIAAKILEESDRGPLSLGRIPPTMLVGTGASKWVDKMGFAFNRVQQDLSLPTPLDFTAIEPGSTFNGTLVTKESLQQHLRFQNLLNSVVDEELPVKADASLLSVDDDDDQKDSSRDSQTTKRKAEEISSQQRTNSFKATTRRIDDELLQDTVGAVCVDRFGRVASGVSSGGIAMKFPGRVSEAALFGAGCWAQDPSGSDAGFACSMTGAGEQISKTLLARSCMEAMVADDDITSAANTLLENFTKSPLLRSYGDKNAGFIAVKVNSLQ